MNRLPGLLLTSALLAAAYLSVNSLGSAPASRKVDYSGIEAKVRVEESEQLKRRTQRSWGDQHAVVECRVLQLPSKVLYDGTLIDKIISYEEGKKEIGVFPADKNGEPAPLGSYIDYLNVCARSRGATTLDNDVFAMLKSANASRVAGDPISSWNMIIPSINVDSYLVTVGRDAKNNIGTPSGPDVIGWYNERSAPGQKGNVILNGHVDWTDRVTGRPFEAILWKLKDIALGEEITLSDGKREEIYVVTEKHRFRADDRSAVYVLNQTTDYRLTLITCDQNTVFNKNTREYTGRYVIIAQRK